MGRRLILGGVFLAGLALAGAGVAGLMGGAASSPPQPGAPSPPRLPSRPLVEILPPTPNPTPTSSPQPAASRAPLARIVIPKLAVDAPLLELGVVPARVVYDKLGIGGSTDDTSMMDIPDRPDDVGVYSSITGGHPGHPGNTVFSGHVNLCNPQGKCTQGVFAGLKNLTDGDTVQVQLDDGIEYSYRVIRNWLVKGDNAPVGEIIGPPPPEEGPEVITLITCGGELFTVSGRHRLYTDRVIVRAVRLYEGTTAARAPR